MRLRDFCFHCYKTTKDERVMGEVYKMNGATCNTSGFIICYLFLKVWLLEILLKMVPASTLSLWIAAFLSLVQKSIFPPPKIDRLPRETDLYCQQSPCSTWAHLRGWNYPSLYVLCSLLSLWNNQFLSLCILLFLFQWFICHNGKIAYKQQPYW